MLTEKQSDTAAPSTHHAPKPGDLDELICYFEGQYVPMREAKVSIMTHRSKSTRLNSSHSR